MCIPTKQKAPPPAPTPIPVEQLVTKVAEGVLPAKNKKVKKAKKDKFNTSRSAPTFGGVTPISVTKALQLK